MVIIRIKFFKPYGKFNLFRCEFFISICLFNPMPGSESTYIESLDEQG